MKTLSLLSALIIGMTFVSEAEASCPLSASKHAVSTMNMALNRALASLKHSKAQKGPKTNKVSTRK